MRLFHGTNVEFDHIDLAECLPYKDFGRGFYLTDIRAQAEMMAKRKSRRFGSAIVMEYEVDIDSLNASKNIAIKRFEEPSKEWAEFIIANRQRSEPSFSHQYDIVIGPVADDGVAYVLNRYLEGSFTIEEVVQQLRFKHLSSQYCFCTDKAIKFLQRL